MHEVKVVLRDPENSPKVPIKVLGDPGLALEGESVVWHFTSLDSRASHARVTFENQDRGGHFFKTREDGRSHQRTVALDFGQGHMLGVVPEVKEDERPRSEKYTVSFLAGETELCQLDPEIIIRKP